MKSQSICGIREGFRESERDVERHVGLERTIHFPNSVSKNVL